MADAHSGAHSRFLAHHFDTESQQSESTKLGMWLFLATEVLFFGGLFCAYCIYRAKNPEIFMAGHEFLDAWLGGVNTAVLIASSFTMAWAVRAAQLGQQKLLITMLSLTLLGAFGFMGIKAVEYNEKFKYGLFPGTYIDVPEVLAKKHKDHGDDSGHAKSGHSDAAGHDQTHGEHDNAPAIVEYRDRSPLPYFEAASLEQVALRPSAPASADANAAPVGVDANAAPADAAASTNGGLGNLEPSRIPQPPAGPVGARPTIVSDEKGHGEFDADLVNIFFGIYFTMTGLHALHVVAGIVVIIWLIARSARGDFSGEYYAPVDLGGLYWHLVDLVWIFLFPMLYLIH